MIHHEPWFTKSAGPKGPFPVIPPTKGEKFEDWFFTQVRNYARGRDVPVSDQFLKLLKPHLRSYWDIYWTPPPARLQRKFTPEQQPVSKEWLQWFDERKEEIKAKEQKRRWREENRDYRKERLEKADPAWVKDFLKQERKQKRDWARSNPGAVQEYKRRWKIKHQERMRTDPEYAEEHRRKVRERKNRPGVKEKIEEAQKRRYWENVEEERAKARERMRRTPTQEASIAKEAWVKRSAPSLQTVVLPDYTDAQHLGDVLDFMVRNGPPTIRAWWDPENERWIALEGSHRIAAVFELFKAFQGNRPLRIADDDIRQSAETFLHSIPSLNAFLSKVHVRIVPMDLSANFDNHDFIGLGKHTTVKKVVGLLRFEHAAQLSVPVKVLNP